MNTPIRNFVTIESIYGPFIINRYCHFQAEALIKTGVPHIQTELDAMMQIVDLLPPNCVAVDGGANAGLVCVPLAQRIRARGGQMHAFEPQRTMYHALCGTVALNQIDNLHLYNMGLGELNTTMSVPPIDYSRDSDFGTVSLQGRDQVGGMLTPVVRLDALGLNRLDFLKLDIEGMEIEALRGARALLEEHLPWCWIEYWKVGAQAIMEEFSNLDYTFYHIDALNLLCVPLSRWDPQRLVISGEPVDRVTVADVKLAAEEPVLAAEKYWNLALTHEERCEWGHAIENWQRAFGQGLDDTAIALQIAWCLCFAGKVDAGLLSLDSAAGDRPMSDGLRGRVEHARSWLLLRGDRRAEAAAATIVSERLLATPLAGLPSEKEYLGQPLAGKRLLVLSYGGMGDQIQHCRYLYALQATSYAELTVIAHPGLIPLLRHNFPDITLIAAHDAWLDPSAFIFDYWCTFVTLAAHFCFEPAPPGMPKGPYLNCPDESRQTWGKWIERRSPAEAWRLGLNWQGRPESDARFHRASSVRDFAPFTQTANTACFSVNRDLIAGNDTCTSRITFPSGGIRDFCDLSGLMLGMDMIVTTCTAQVHLAGALGVPAILLLSPKPDARWGITEHTELYAGVHIVRAGRAGHWDDAIDQALTLIHATRIASKR